jgi:hypothetical protein
VHETPARRSLIDRPSNNCLHIPPKEKRKLNMFTTFNSFRWKDSAAAYVPDGPEIIII